MYVVTMYPNDGSSDPVMLGMYPTRKKAMRSIFERDLSTDLTLMSNPNGKVIVRRVYSPKRSHVVFSRDVANLDRLQDPRGSARGTGSVKAYGLNMKGRITERSFSERQGGKVMKVAAKATLMKHPIDDSYRRANLSDVNAEGRESLQREMASLNEALSPS